MIEDTGPAFCNGGVPGIWTTLGDSASAPAQNCRGRGMQPSMIAVIFEVWPASGRKEDYLAIAATLRAELEQIDGFISVERFQSLTDAGKLLSLSFWRDEEAV